MMLPSPTPSIDNSQTIGFDYDLSLVEYKMEDNDKKVEWIKLMTVSSQLQEINLHDHVKFGPICYLEEEKVLWYRQEWDPSISAQFEIYNLNRSNIIEPFSIHGSSGTYRDWATNIESCFTY
ncbi:hypothetical protein LguiB_014008 [Lonicera macranthoides]